MTGRAVGIWTSPKPIGQSWREEERGDHAKGDAPSRGGERQNARISPNTKNARVYRPPTGQVVAVYARSVSELCYVAGSLGVRRIVVIGSDPE